jgi:lysophospholipase L1-like esterase
MYDYLHPSAKGCQIWAEAIEPFVSQHFDPLPPEKPTRKESK